MKRFAVFIAAGVLAASLPCLGQSEPATDELVTQGIALHDKGDYDGAIRKYREALKANPNDARINHELAFSLSAKKDCKGAVEAATAGLREPSKHRAALYMILGSCRDDLGDPKGALEAYQQGIAEQPRLWLLHFNVGITYVGLKQWTDARRALQRSVGLKPDHASSHIALAKVYEEEGYTVPAILANARFLYLEPNSARSPLAVAALDRLFRIGFEVEGKKNVAITIDPDSKIDEGDFHTVEFAAVVGQAGSHMDEQNSKKTEPEVSLDRMASEIGLIGESTPTTGGFAAEYYGPFVAGLHKQGFDTVFAYYAYQSAGPEVRAWLGKHEVEVAKMKQWVAGLRWPESTPKAADAKAGEP